MKNKKKIIISIGLILIGLTVWQFNKKEPEQPYITTKVKKENLGDSVLATGTIDASKSVDVGAQVSGQIKKLNVILGQEVKEGDLIAEIDSVPQQNTLLDAEAALENFKAQLQSRLVSLDKSQINFNRQQNLFKNNATSKENFDLARVELASARADIAQVQSQIKQAENSLNTAKVNLGYTKIISPISGIVVSVPVDEGQTVNANQTTPTIVKIAQLDTVTIKAEIAEGDVIKVRPGMEVTFTVLGDSDKVYESVLKSIDPGPQSFSDKTGTGSNTSASTTSGTAIYYYGTFDVPNPDRLLRISMTAQVSIILKQAKDALSIPSSAIKRNQNRESVVRVVNPQGIIEERVVTIGLNNSIQAEVLSGLSLNDEIIVSQASNENKLDLSKRRIRM